MGQPVFYQTLSNMGVDPTFQYNVSASVTPETPAPPFIVGTRAFGSDGSEFVFVQASTSISLTDFVALSATGQSGGYYANSVTNTNIGSSLLVGFGSTGLVLKASVSYIPAGGYFWCMTKGQNIPATTSNGLASNLNGVVLYTTGTAGVISSVTTSSTLACPIGGIICVNSLTISIATSLCPPAGGTQSNGYTVGPVVNMNNPRSIASPVTLTSNSVAAVGNTLPVVSW
jgi:hypothetical protein